MKDRDSGNNLIVRRESVNALVKACFRGTLKAKDVNNMNEYYRLKGIAEALCFIKGDLDHLKIGGN